MGHEVGLIPREAILGFTFVCYHERMEGFKPNKKTPENKQFGQEDEIELTLEEQAGLRATLDSIDFPNAQKKSPEESQVKE